MKVSIIIPAYNQDVYVSQAIESALNQDYPDLEVILSDDNSVDGTSDLAKKYLEDKRFKYFKNEINLGRVANYHRALYDYVTGDYALILDGDDYLIDKGYVKKAVSLISEERLIAVFARSKVFLERSNKFIENKMNDGLHRIMDGNWLFLNYYKGYAIPHFTMLYDRKYALQIGYFDKDIISSDWESFLRLILGKKVGFINEPIGVWRRHGNNCTRSLDAKVTMANLEYIDGPYEFCILNNIFEKKKIERWKRQMTRRYFVKNLLKLLIIGESQKFDDLSSIFKKYNKKVYNSVVWDLKFILMRIIIKNKMLTKFIFKNVLKIESFYEDLI